MRPSCGLVPIACLRRDAGAIVAVGRDAREGLAKSARPEAKKLGFLDANPTSTTSGLSGHGAYIREAAQRGGIAAAYVVIAGKFDRAASERVWATVIVGGEKVDPTACEKTFDAMEKEAVNGLIVSDGGDLLAVRQLIADLAARFRVPAIYPYREFVEAGGLMAYGVDVADLMRRVATMKGQLLGGAKPSDIPFYRQTKYELVLNQKAARSLGLEFPATLMTAADAVVHRTAAPLQRDLGIKRHRLVRLGRLRRHATAGAQGQHSPVAAR